MHEVAAMQGAVHTALMGMQKAGASRATAVQLMLGAAGHFSAEAATQHFEILTRGTPLEGATLSIQWLPATYQCFSCLQRFESEKPAEQVACPACGEIAFEIAHQDVCFISAVDCDL